MDPFNNVYPTLVECFGIVLIGYLCGRLNVFSESQANGIQVYISRIALPAIIFKSMVELDFSQVDWTFWCAILISKSGLFLFVVLVTLLVSKPVSKNLGKAGIFAIFVTQSNDLALGLPLFDAIFKSTHPEYLQYIYLLIPISVALLNPIGFILLEFNKITSDKDSSISKRQVLLKTLKGVLTNPLVFMVIFGLVVNQIFTACNVDKSDWFLTPFLRVLADSFGATALFYLGISLVGNMNKYGGFNLVVPFLLVVCKSLLFPMIARESVFWLSSNTTVQSINSTHDPGSLASFAFVYGTLPTAPPVVLFATMYNAEVDTIGTSMVLGTMLSAPIMFVSSKMISMMSSAYSDVDKALKRAIFDLGILSSVCCVWVILVFISTKLYRRSLHQYVLCLVTMQFLSSLAISLSETCACRGVLAVYLIGLFGSECWIGLLTYGLTAVRCKGERYAVKRKLVIFGVGLIIPVSAGLILSLSSEGSEFLHAKNYTTNPFLIYSRDSKWFNIVHSAILIISVITTVVCLIILQRCDKYCRCKELNAAKKEMEPLLNGTDSQGCKNVCRQCTALCQKQLDIEDMPPRSCNHTAPDAPSCSQACIHCPLDICEDQIPPIRPRNHCAKSYGSLSPLDTCDENTFNDIKDVEEMSLEEYLKGEKHQLSQHIILVLFMSLFSILSIFLALGRAFGQSERHHGGIYLEIEFLVVLCSVGQGFVSFAVFGFNKIFFSFVLLERFNILQPFCFAKKIHLKPVSMLAASITNLCARFRSHHLENCKIDLVTDLKFHLRTYREVFCGTKLVDWLIEFGLANTRLDAVYYGNCLLRGRVIRHCQDEHYFYDLPYFYRFCLDTPDEANGLEGTV